MARLGNGIIWQVGYGSKSNEDYQNIVFETSEESLARERFESLKGRFMDKNEYLILVKLIDYGNGSYVGQIIEEYDGEESEDE